MRNLTKVFLATATILSMASSAHAANWDGAWGPNKGAVLQVNGSIVNFALRGVPYRVTDVSVSPQRLRFTYGEFGGIANFSMTSDRTADMVLQSGQGTLRGTIKRGR